MRFMRSAGHKALWWACGQKTNSRSEVKRSAHQNYRSWVHPFTGWGIAWELPCSAGTPGSWHTGAAVLFGGCRVCALERWLALGAWPCSLNQHVVLPNHGLFSGSGCAELGMTHGSHDRDGREVAGSPVPRWSPRKEARAPRAAALSRDLGPISSNMGVTSARAALGLTVPAECPAAS